VSGSRAGSSWLVIANELKSWLGSARYLNEPSRAEPSQPRVDQANELRVFFCPVLLVWLPEGTRGGFLAIKDKTVTDIFWSYLRPNPLRDLSVFESGYSTSDTYHIRIWIIKSHIYDVDVQSYSIRHGWHYSYLNLNPIKNMKTNMIWVISVRIRSVFIPTCNHTTKHSCGQWYISTRKSTRSLFD
jgi:hypothetical protein